MLRQIVGGAVASVVAFALGWGISLVCWIALTALTGCGSSQLVACKLDAVKFLPEDPMQVTPYDVEDLVGRLHACKQAGSDAGR